MASKKIEMTPDQILESQALLTANMIAVIIGKSRYTAFRLIKESFSDVARRINREWYVEKTIFIKRFRAGKLASPETEDASPDQPQILP